MEVTDHVSVENVDTKAVTAIDNDNDKNGKNDNDNNNDNDNGGDGGAYEADVASHGSRNDDNDDNNYEEDPPPREADESKANQLSFATLCRRLDKLWQQRQKRGGLAKQSRQDLLWYLLPSQLSQYLAGTSPFPLFRLIMPEIDTSRPHTGMKEKTIATVWGEAMGLNRKSRAFEKLQYYQDPHYAGPTAAGDLSVALYEVMKERYPEKPSTITVGQMNELLDEVTAIRKWVTAAKVSTHDWRKRDSDNNKKESGEGFAGTGKGSYVRKQKSQIQWVEKLIRLGVSPLEHKWIARIMLQRLEIGIGWKAILAHYHRWATDLYSANNSLKNLCQCLSDPEWISRKERREEMYLQALQDQNRDIYMPRAQEGVSLGNTVAPMLAERTTFAGVLHDVGARHAQYAQTLPAGANKTCLPLAFPTFEIEVKLDGERMLIHIKRGIVTMQTRKAKWYSQLYSPILGPPLRAAIANYDVDVILDGEVISWDDSKRETIAFGVNRTVAKLRRDWCQRHGMIDERDLGLHATDTDDINVMTLALSSRFEKELANVGEDAGAHCWLQFVVFDILYVGGPGAADLLAKADHVGKHLASEARPPVHTGSILDLDGQLRKCIMYTLLTPQPKLVELVESTVVRSNGECQRAAEYFSPTAQREFGHHPTVLDSIPCALNGSIPNYADLDQQRRSRRSVEEIHQDRADGIDRVYSEIVERQCQEGLIFKDLACPYLLGDASRKQGYWFKLKADYEKLGHASDVDVVVLGAYYASGMSVSGLLNHFLVGCIDPDAPDGSKYMTLGKVSGQGTRRENLLRLLEMTGFQTGSSQSSTQGNSFGKWFKEHEHHKSLPDFMSKRSFQRSMHGDQKGWKFERIKYPDLWIRPEDSFVLTLNAAEIVSTDDYAAGVTLRFPRIAAIRAEGFDDPKPAHEVETVLRLHDLYFERQEQIREMQQRDNEGSSQSALHQSQSASASIGHQRFLTPTMFEKRERAAKRKNKRKAQLLEVTGASSVPTNVQAVSSVLRGCTFTVLEGRYQMDNKTRSLDALEAKEQGWFEEASAVKCSNDVRRFIKLHGGTCQLTGGESTDFVVGGSAEDATVDNFRRAIQSASSAAALSDKNRNLKKYAGLRKMMETGGVVKWTFVFYAVHHQQRKNQQQDGDGSDDGDESDGCSDPCTKLKLLTRRWDYLVLSELAQERLQETEDEFGMKRMEKSNLIEFRRALQFVGRTQKKKKTRDMREPTQLPWQFRALESFGTSEEVSAFGGKRQKLWHNEDSVGVVKLYPDLFEDCGLEKEKDVIVEMRSTKDAKHPCQRRSRSASFEVGHVASVLPLARAMGAQVSNHLHNGVTHVLWDDGGGLPTSQSVDVEELSRLDGQLNEKLKERLEALLAAPSVQTIQLVSPGWVQQKWCSTT